MVTQIATMHYDSPPIDRRAIDLVCPEVVTSPLALYFIHGGGWYAGDRQLYYPLLDYFSARGHLCASAGYRIDEDTRLNDKMSDLLTGYRLMQSYLSERGQSPRIVVIGSSAGAHLASLLALRSPSQFGHEDNGLARPVACVHITGPGTTLAWPDMNSNIKRRLEQLCGAAYDLDPAADGFRSASPELDICGVPPDFLFLVAELERVFAHTYVHALSSKIVAHGARSEVVEIPDADHGFLYGTDEECQKMALAIIEEFLTECAGQS